MSQQINLLNPLFRRQRFSFTSPAAMLYGIGFVAALGLAVAAYQSIRLRAIETQAKAVAHSLKDLQAQQEALGAKSAVRKPDPNLETRVLDLNTQVKVRQEIIGALKGGSVGMTAGFSEYMRAFSRQHVEGVWLTAFDIAAGGSDLTIAGRALSADLIPAYLQRLNKEAPMQGRRLASVTINQAPPTREAAKPAPEAKETEPRPSLPPYLDFTISSGDLGGAAGADKKAAPAMTPLPRAFYPAADSSSPGMPKAPQ